jgi:sulfate adenylyltransferase subunit 1 (EFTu-like GTPase family)
VKVKFGLLPDRRCCRARRRLCGIVTYEGNSNPRQGESVTLELDDEIDGRRGDMLGLHEPAESALGRYDA